MVDQAGCLSRSNCADSMESTMVNTQYTGGAAKVGERGEGVAMVTSRPWPAHHVRGFTGTSKHMELGNLGVSIRCLCEV